MKRRILVLLPIFLLCAAAMQAQIVHYQKAARYLRPDKEFDNVLVQRLFGDAKASGFVIWIKQAVPPHWHADHSETVLILKGKATMTLGNQSTPVRRGDIIFIPKGSPHSVTVSHGILKVLSVQAPEFDGTDRILLTK